MSNYKIQCPLFWLVTAMGSLIAVGRAAQFIRPESFAHPIRFVGDIAAVVGMWIGYFGVLRGLRTAQGQVADTVLIGIADSAAICCLLGYGLAVAAFGLS
jgi:hypothetical protein